MDNTKTDAGDGTFNATHFVDRNLDQITDEELSELTREQRNEVRVAEQAGRNRSSLIDQLDEADANDTNDEAQGDSEPGDEVPDTMTAGGGSDIAKERAAEDQEVAKTIDPLPDQKAIDDQEQVFHGLNEELAAGDPELPEEEKAVVEDEIEQKGSAAERFYESGEDRPPQHGGVNAANQGLQSDASGHYESNRNVRSPAPGTRV